MQLNEYITLGRSGLRVSPLSLGTMTFGTEWRWGAEESVSRSLFDLQNMIHGAKVHAWTPNRVSPSQPASQREEAVGAEKFA